MNVPKQTYDAASYTAAFLPDKSVHQSDERIFHRGGFDYDAVASVESAGLEDAVLSFVAVLESGEKAVLRIVLVSEEILRLQFSRQGTTTAFTATSDMLIAATVSARLRGADLRETTGGWSLGFGARTLEVDRTPFQLRILDAARGVIFRLERYMLAGKHLTMPLGFRRERANPARVEPCLSWHIHNHEKFFGLGEKWNKVEKSSTRATVWASETCGSNASDLSYKPIPYLLSSRGWGLVLHSSFRSFWEVGTFSYVAGSCLCEDDKFDAFLFFGEGFKELIRVYTSLTGRPQPVPRWALGVWMSRCQYETKEEAEAAMDGLRARGIPADVIHLDPLWMKTHYYFKIGVDACDFTRNDKAFPDLPGLWRTWKTNGFKTCLWVNPYLPEGTPVYEFAAQHGYLLKSRKGGLARLSHGEPVGMVDFSNPEARAWWKGKLKEVLADGAAVLKPDYGDRVPEDALFHDGRTGRELHNLYVFWFSETCYQACKEVHGYGLVWRRAGYIGSQRYPGTWAGDTRSSWEEMLCCLRGGLSAGFNGDAFWAADIGGFTGEPPTPELYIRWAQWGLLSPHARFHGANCPREPWHFGDTAVAVVKHYATLRYRLLPYLERCAAESYAKGTPILRHMHLEFPGEPGTEHIDDQYMLGPDLLVAPVFEPGARSRPVYFPTGAWTHLEDSAIRFSGPAWHTASAPLEHIPVFRRAGAEIPMEKPERQFIA